MNYPTFEDVAVWYQDGFWSEFMVKEAVVCEVITPKQYKEITGKDYVA